jgi:hypothetical protein
MVLPASTPIELNEILTEFDAPERTPLGDMVRGGAYVPADNISGENSAIPTSTPIQISDFFSANGNPNPYQIVDEDLIPVPNGNPVVRLLSNKRREGLFVAAHDGSLTVADAATFVIDMKIRLAANALTEPDRGSIQGDEAWYTDLRRVMGIWVGLTSQDPETSSNNQMLGSTFGFHINFYDTEDSTGIGTVGLGRYVNGFQTIEGGGGVDGDGYIETSDSTYEDDILPSVTNYVNLRLERGNPSNAIDASTYAADWICRVYDDDTWSNQTHIKTAANGATGFNLNDANIGGYLIMVVDAGHENGNLQVDIGDVRVFAGGQAVPW